MKTEEEIRARLEVISDYDERDYVATDIAIIEEKMALLQWVLGD